MIFAGVDVGSMSAEAVLMTDDRIVAHATLVVKPNPVVSATLVMDAALQKANLGYGDVTCCVSTGYGREKIPFAGHNLSEISCHGKGAFWANPEIRTIIDVGGQDCKVVRVDDGGNLKDFVMNDKCAAGTGRFLEGIAKILGVPVSELGPLSLRGEVPVPISSICTVFTQFDVMCLLAEGKSREDVGLGVALALATRINRLVNRVGIEDRVCVTGGVAKNAAVVKALGKVLGREIAGVGVDPQIVGALGAALSARETHLKGFRRAPAATV